ncbi:MAG: hypothetical protein OXU22_06885 [Gammaproteobacteria bacterium]|nr:hypothetical protein [Gammaproteobacteria bacterium]
MSDLYFRLGEMKGFTAIELANKSEGYANPIRELLQNSLDASRETGQEKCEIDIYIQTIDKSEIPHIDRYEEILKKAIETQRSQKSLNANNQRVVDSIKSTLEKPKIKVLMFADNGTGMNKDKVNAILTGMSVHENEQSGGSFGVGHLSSYSLSSLRYVLYATKYRQGGKSTNLFTGSPILAGHNDGANQRGSRGRIVEKAPANENDPEFIYPTRFPGFIAPKMENIDRGTMVSILGLAEEWDEEAEYAIVSNFFHAISHDALSVKIHKDGQPSKSIRESEVESLIASRKEGKRAMRENILSGKAVYQALDAVVGKENQKQIKLRNGELVYVCIKTDSDSIPTITLIRNGMLIARHDTMLSDDMNNLRKNENVEAFTAVIDVDQGHSPELFNLVKGAEGPYHNRLEKGRLRVNEEKALKKLFKELSAKIGEHLQEVKRDSFDLPLFSIPNESARATGGNKSSGQTRDAKPRGGKKPPGPRPPPSPPTPHPPRPKPVVVSRSLEAKTAVRYTDESNKWKVELRIIPKAQDARDEVYLSVCVGEDNDDIEAQTYLDFVTVEMNGRKVTIPEVKNQVKLGELKEAAQYDIIAQIEKPSDMETVKVALLPILGLKRTQTTSKKQV